MSRPLVASLAAALLIVLALAGLAALDRPVAPTHVEQPVADAPAH